MATRLARGPSGDGAQTRALQEMGGAGPRRRRHGLERPLHPAQLVVAGIWLLSSGVFYGLSVRELPSYVQQTVLVLYSAQLAVTAGLFLAISVYDPADPALIARRRDREAPGSTGALDAHSAPTYATVSAQLPTSTRDQATPNAFATSRVAKCGVCDVLLVRRTRHCSVCNKCVAGFDHHCVYLNTCIGSRNYQLFVGLLSCTMLQLLTQLIVTGYSIARVHAQSSESRPNGSAIIAAMIALSVLPLMQLICIIVLASFHIYLSFRHMTTYEVMYEWFERHYEQQQQQQHAHEGEKHLEQPKSDHAFLDAHGRLELGFDSTTSTSRSSSLSGTLSSTSGGVGTSSSNSNSNSNSNCSSSTSSDSSTGRISRQSSALDSDGASVPVAGWMKLKRAHSVVLLHGIPTSEFRREFEERRRSSLSEPAGTTYVVPTSGVATPITSTETPRKPCSTEP